MAAPSTEKDSRPFPVQPAVRIEPAVMRRFRFRYNLRALIAVFLCIGPIMGWLAHLHRQIQRERAALAEIRDVQAKMTAPSDAWIDDPLDVESVQLPWWLAWGGQRDVEQAVGVGFKFGWNDEQLDPETEISDREMRLIAHMPRIKRLEIPHSKVGDAGLAHLASLRYLETLDLSATKITDRGLRHLAHLRSLKELKLNNMDISGAGIQHLARCPQLQALEVFGLDTSTEYAGYFGQITSLESLRIGGGDFERFRLRGLSRFRDLVLYGRDCTEFEFTDLPALQSLSLSCQRIDRLVLRSLPRLTSLSIHAECISQEAVDYIGGVASLRQLHLSRSPINNDGLKAIGRLRVLANLHLQNTTVDDRAMSAFAGLWRLKRLSLHAPAVGRQGLNHLRHLRNLESLTLAGIRCEGHLSLMRDSLPNLCDLYLGECRFRELRCSGHANLEDIAGYHTELDAICLEDLPDLRRIAFSGLRVQRFSLQRLPRLGWLHLSILHGTEVTSARLCDLPRLEHLAFVGISAEGSIEDLPSPVKMPIDVFDHSDSYPRLRRLDISHIDLPERAQRKLVEIRKRSRGR